MRAKRIAICAAAGWLFTIMFFIGSLVGAAAKQPFVIIAFGIATAISAIISIVFCVKWCKYEREMAQDTDPPAYDFV